MNDTHRNTHQQIGAAAGEGSNIKFKLIISYCLDFTKFVSKNNLIGVSFQVHLICVDRKVLEISN